MNALFGVRASAGLTDVDSARQQARGRVPDAPALLELPADGDGRRKMICGADGERIKFTQLNRWMTQKLGANFTYLQVHL